MDNNLSNTSIKAKSPNVLSTPLLIIGGTIGLFLMILMLSSVLMPKKVTVISTPTPLLERSIPTPTTNIIIPSQKISSNSALQEIYDAESSTASILNQMDFNEEKLIHPKLDMTISF